MIKQLGWISVAALSLAALSACDGQPKPTPAPTETKAATNATAETIHVEPEAKMRFESMSNRLAPITANAGVQIQPQVQPAAAGAIDEQKLKIEARKSGALPQLPVTMSGGVQ